MKNLILPIILLLYLFLPINISAQDSFQEKNITCGEAKKILTTAECPFWARKLSTVWCYQEEFKGTTAEEAMAYADIIMSRPPSYILDSNSCLEGPGADQEESDQQTQPGQAKSNTSEAKSQSSESTNPLPVFMGEWFRFAAAGLNLYKGIYETEILVMSSRTLQDRINTEKDIKYINNLDDNYVWHTTGYTKDRLEEIIGREPDLSNDYVRKLREIPQTTPYSIDILNGQAQIKLPGQNDWSDLKQGDKIPPGSTVFTGMDTTTVLTIENKGVVQIAPFSEVIINESGLEQATLNKELFNDIQIDKGEIEVNIESGVFTAPILDVHTPNATTSVRGTHLWVSYKDNQTVVGVYEGKVEVKTKDGRVKEVTPNSDQPGVIVISQKLSSVKLGIAGVVLTAVLGGVIMILRRKFAPRINKKKK